MRKHKYVHKFGEATQAMAKMYQNIIFFQLNKAKGKAADRRGINNINKTTKTKTKPIGSCFECH